MARASFYLMSNVLIIGGHGMGDALMSLQCAQIVQENGKNPKVLLAVRDEIYKPLSFLFERDFNIQQGPDSIANDNALLKDLALFEQVTKDYKEAYYVLPDLLFNNKHSFDYELYDTNPQVIRSTRLLTKNRVIQQNIYLGLMSTTPGYSYEEPMTLAIELAKSLPKYNIYFPIVTKWANQDIKDIEVPKELPVNLIVVRDGGLSESLVLLRTCRYFIGTDNGPSHIAYHMGIPRLLLDPQYNRLPWLARWREDYLESIPIATRVPYIVDVVKTNLEIPQTTLIPRATVLLNSPNSGANWSQQLFLKTQ